MSKVRIINDKTGEVKFVSEFVAKNEKQLKSAGFRVQNLEQKKEDELPEKTIESEDLLNDNTLDETLLFDNLVEEQPTKVKGKPGRKPNTITE